MKIQKLVAFFMWCTIINGGLLIFWTTMCELIPRILSLNSSVKPVITARTTIRAITPTITPATEMIEMREINPCFLFAFR